MDRYIESREQNLLIHLLKPQPGERILALLDGRQGLQDVLKARGCLLTVLDYPCEVVHTGVDASWSAHDELPFADNEFDSVILISSLAYANNPDRLIGEAIRVSRGQVFLGVDNRHSIVGLSRRIKGLFGCVEKKGRLFSIRELKRIITTNLGGGTRIQWGSVIFMPCGWYRLAAPVEAYIPVIGNPFGAFMGLSFSVTYRYRTIQETIKPFSLGINAHEFTGNVRRNTIASLRFSIHRKTKNR